MEFQPLLTIITVCYNAHSTIKRTLESIDSQEPGDMLDQAIEHLIIDGASTDGTLELIEAHAKPWRHVVSEPDNGLYFAMNKGLEMARGEYVLFMNAGDSFHGNDGARRILQAIDGILLPGIIYGQTILVDAEGRKVGERHLRAPRTLDLNSFSDGMLVCHQAFVALRKICSPFNTRLRYSADYEWCINCLQHSRRNVYLGDEPLVEYLAEGLTTRHRLASLLERFRVMSYFYGPGTAVKKHVKFIVRLLKSRKGQPRN